MQMNSGTHSRWAMPLFSLALGGVVFAAFTVGGNARDGAFAFAALAAVGLLFAIGGPRSETLAGLAGPGRDERWASIDLRASALSGFVMLLATIGAWLYELADGRDGSPYGQLAAVGGLAYVAGVAVQRWRA